MDLGLQDRVALVIGGSSGLGRAIAAELVAEGARVAIASRSRDKLDEAAAAVGAYAGLCWDTDDVDGAGPLLEAAEAALDGPVEVLVTNTGGPPSGPDPLGFSRDDWEAAYRSLVLAPMALVERVVPAMRARGFGRVVNVSSTSVREPIDYLVLSSSHRAAMIAAFKTIARDAARDGVTLNTLLPGHFGTERLFVMRPDAAESAQAEPAGRLGEPAELAAAAAFLCSTRASFITGEVLTVDGGLTRGVF